MSNTVLIPLAVLGPIVLTGILGVFLAWLGPFLTRYFKQNAHKGVMPPAVQKPSESGVTHA